MAIAEPKGVAHKVEALTVQLLEMNNELNLIKQENLQLTQKIIQLVNRVEELSELNAELSANIACIDPSSSTDELLAIDSRALRDYMRSIQPDLDLTIELEDNETGDPFEIKLPITANFFWPSV